MGFNPFTKKQPSQEELIKQDQDYNTDSTILGQSLPQSTDDAYIQLERQKENADLVKWQQSNNYELDCFIYDLRGMYNEGDEEKPNWKEQEGAKRISNERFIKKVITLARPLLSKNLIMSNYTDDRILLNLGRVVGAIRVDLLQNREIYDIKKEDMAFVVGSFKEVIEAAYFRAWNNGERRHLSTIGRDMRIHTDRPEPVKKSIFSGLGG